MREQVVFLEYFICRPQPTDRIIWNPGGTDAVSRHLILIAVERSTRMLGCFSSSSAPPP